MTFEWGSHPIGQLANNQSPNWLQATVLKWFIHNICAYLVHARHLIAAALEVEVTEVMNKLKSVGRDVVRNGYLPERSVTTAIGDVEVQVPRIRARDGASINFASKLIPPYLRRSKSIDAWVAYAYLKGVSEGDMAGVLGVVLGEGAKKLTPSVVSSLKVEWKAKFDEWKKRDLSRDTFSYIYADGIYQEIRGDNPKLCVLVDGHEIIPKCGHEKVPTVRPLDVPNVRPLELDSVWTPSGEFFII